MDHFNKLTPEQLEALAILSEECAEVVQIIGKIVRHGLGSHQPDTGVGNAVALEKELGDVRAAVEIARSVGLVSPGSIERFSIRKLHKIEKYLHHIHLEVTA